MVRYLNLALLMLLFAACSDNAVEPAPEVTDATTAVSETERLQGWLDEVFQAELEYSPMTKTQLGMIDDLDAYSRWDDFSDAAEVAENAREQAYLEELRERFDVNELDEEGRISYRFAEYQWEISERQHSVRESVYVYSPMQDTVSGLTTFLINNHRIEELAHAGAWLSRVEDIDVVIDELIRQAEERAENGVLLPSFAWPRLLESARSQISGAPFGADSDEDSALLADFTAKVEALGLPGPDREQLIAEAETQLQESYEPAVQRYISSLQQLQEGADERAGVWKLPHGEAFYEVQVARYTTRDDMTADQIHQIGLDEVERIQQEMRGIMEQVGFDGSLAEFFEHLRTDPQFYYPNNDEGRARYLRESAEMIEQVMQVAPDYFNRLPEADLEVRAVEPYREATATGAFYNQPALDGSRPGYYYVNLSNMANNPHYLMESLAYHEGAPGHHFQLALAQELEDLPMMQRLTFHSAYVEGWGLYAEYLGKDMGFFTDPYKDFGRLSYELFRAVRLVVDTGLHSQRWTRQEAIDYMMANTPMTEGDITPEVERYIVWPAQALSYKIGMMTILDLREQAMAELGEQFSWGDFHDAVLTAGSLPLPVLTARVEDWIDSVRQ